MNCFVNSLDYHVMNPHTDTMRDVSVGSFSVAKETCSERLGELLCITQLEGGMTSLQPRLSGLSRASILCHSHTHCPNKPYIIHLICNSFHGEGCLACWRYKNCLMTLEQPYVNGCVCGGEILFKKNWNLCISHNKMQAFYWLGSQRKLIVLILLKCFLFTDGMKLRLAKRETQVSRLSLLSLHYLRK